ncbi:MAG TPA: hypothetical protein V6C65_04610 [Allocoleopsis sp.]
MTTFQCFFNPATGKFQHAMTSTGISVPYYPECPEYNVPDHPLVVEFLAGIQSGAIDISDRPLPEPVEYNPPVQEEVLSSPEPPDSQPEPHNNPEGSKLD